MTNNPPIPQRKSIRLPGYDYTQSGAYFITLVTWQRECLFGEIVGDSQEGGVPEMRLNPYGEILSRIWQETVLIRPYVMLDEFVIMPNHVHGILIIQETRRKGDPPGRPIPEDHPMQTGRGGDPENNMQTERGNAQTERGSAQTGPGNAQTGRDSAQTGRGNASPLPRIVAGSIGAIIGQIKSLATKQINELRQTPGAPVWHRNYYDRIIRNERELDGIRYYIQDNPRRWAEDEENLTRM